MSNSKLCVAIDMHLVFVQVLACQMLKTCKSLVKKLHANPQLLMPKKSAGHAIVLLLQKGAGLGGQS
jgi:hypothetical protein